MLKSKIFRYICLPIIVVIIGLGGYYLYQFHRYKSDVERIRVMNVDLNTIGDGEYIGDCDVFFVTAKVRVVVKDGKITELELIKHHNDRGSSANVIPERIITEQQIDVDAVTGATNSSKVIQEATYNALTGKRTI
jgi:Uncharacterized protein conserved in bacteria